ncbi:TIM barrel protein [uncultured Algibacter sp.]|uniref:sugar phosphate isomerase/epimerase family protein n=1 Tax=uncultured Algibacter sp. TaxID=298659 RepID=UPI0026261596|nr:TIM barrel protein [uncultured Algibacter sp.]
MSSNKRRNFIKTSALVAGAIVQLGIYQDAWAYMNSLPSDPLDINVFSKHLHFLDYKSLGEKANELGFSGVDLTVRNHGHVLPENVNRDLPLAIDAINRSGSKCTMITTAIESVQNPLDINVLKMASKCGITYYRTNWFRYSEEEDMLSSIRKYKKQIQELTILNKELDLIGCYQNHSGIKVGASYWEVYQLLEGINSMYFGTQYDIRHAIAEGANSWENGLRLLKPYIRTIVLKDFKWQKVKGKWKVVNVPIGEGLVNFTAYFRLLKQYKLRPPVSLHLEYDLGGAEKGMKSIKVNKEVVYNAMKKDLDMVQKLWRLA